MLIVLCIQFEKLIRGLTQARIAQAALDKERHAERNAIGAEQRLVFIKLSNRLRALAVGDLSSQLAERLPGECDRARTLLNVSCAALDRLVGAVAFTAERVVSGAHKLREASGDLAGERQNSRPSRSRPFPAPRASCCTISTRRRRSGLTPAQLRWALRPMPVAAPAMLPARSEP